MTDDLFRKGGPFKIKKTGPDQVSMSVPIPKDEDGRIARACPNEECAPGYFKVMLGTGITDEQHESFCPYCRHATDPNDFATKEQIRYAHDHAFREVQDGVDRMVKQSFGLGSSNRRRMCKRNDFISMEVSYKPSLRKPIRKPLEEQVRRDVVCPHCGLDHSVYGLATWCPDCGEDIFLTHVEAEFTVVTSILGDVARRRETMGERVAAKDIENCLEDVVSIFEAVLKIVVRRVMDKRGNSEEEVETLFKRMGSGFQSLDRTAQFLSDNLEITDMPGLSKEECNRLRQIFEKRHPITHNLGVVDRKYIERASSDELEGREIVLTESEVKEAMGLSGRFFKKLISLV